MTKVGQSALAVIVLVLAAAFTLNYINNRNEGNPTLFEAVGFWQPGDNQTRWEIRIGQQSERFHPTGPQHTYDGEAVPGTVIEVIIWSLSEEPVIISECYLEFDEEHIQGEVTREGALCRASAIIPPIRG